ncbi:hypothetical protein BBJ28_00000166 [Nothophytophthora sp. Chile5]|nr:hypothetical protein BBJ28_00000166 [Nothophytophthora sp. Chile5]
MEALLLADGANVRDRHRELEEETRLAVHERKGGSKDDVSVAEDSSSSVELTDSERETLARWHIVQRALSLDARWPTSQLRKKLVVLESVLERLYAPDGGISCVTSPSNKSFGWHGAALTSPSRSSTADSNSPVPFKELPLPTQIALRMFFRACQSLRDPAKLATNSRLSVQIASKLPSILASMPSCVLSPGVVDDTSVESEECANVWSVFQQLFRLFAELLGLPCVSASSDGCTSTAAVQNELVCLTANERAIVITAYVALSLKWGRLRHLLVGLALLLESGSELSASHFESLVPLFHDLVTATAEHPPSAFAEEEQFCGYLMSFGKGDHGKLGHGQCTHASCQEGNCTENKAVPTVIAATRDISFRKIDSLSTHSIAITAKGEAMSWGNGDKYRLGHGSSTKEYAPRTIDFLSLKGRVRDLACGLGHTLALMDSGELYAWGNGSNGRLGTGDTSDRSNPTKVVLPASTAKVGLRDGVENPERLTVADEPLRFRHVFCGASHSLGLSWDGRAFCWGKNNQGQCGHGHTNDQWTIQEIESFRSNDDEEAECVVHAAGGWEHTLFCTASGRVYSCGCGYKDSRRAGIPPVLGHGDCDRRLEPTLIEALEDSREEVVKVACGWDHSLAVSASGRVYTWGSGTNGKLGHGDEENCDIPTLVRSMEGERVKEAKAGCEHTVLLTHDHELWTCGQGDSGRLGHGDNQTRKCPTKVELFAQGGLKPVAIAVGDKYNLVLVDDGDGQCENDGQSERLAIPRVSCHMGSIYSLVLSEGQFLPDEYALWTRSGDDALFSKPIAAILDWESVGVFEVEDELVESEDLSQSGSGGNTLLGPSEIHDFLFQFTEAELSGKSQAFWVWVVEHLSRSGGFSEVLVPPEMQHFLGVISSVAVWHLNLVSELRNCYRLYETESTNPDAVNRPASTSGKLWELFAAILEHLTRVAQLDGPIDENGVANAVTTARFLLKLQPNSELMSPILRAAQESTVYESRWKSADDFATDLIRFLNRPVDLTALRASIAANSVDISLLRTGLCIFHDLLRKLTSSSTKTCLLAEFVDVVCAKGGPACPRNLVKLMSNALNQLTVLDQEDAKSLGKAVENLFVRVTKIISSDDSSFELKKKALIVWTVPLAVNRRDASGAVDLVVKAGIMSVVTELLLEEAGVVETHIAMNTMDRCSIVEHETGNHGVRADRYRWISFPSLKPGADPRLSPKMTPVKALLFAQTTAQTLAFLAWESFCAVSMLLSKSTFFGEQSPALLLRSGGSITTVQGKEPPTTSLSPRKRLTLPKKTIISTIDQSIEQMSDGLFLMLQKVRGDLRRINNSVQELTSVLTPSKTLARSNDNASRQHNDSRVFLLGSPVQISMSSKHVVQIVRPGSTSDATTGVTAFTLSFWIYVDETGAMATTPHTEGGHGDDLPPDDGNVSEHTVCVLALGAGAKGDLNPETEQSACEREDEDVTFVAYTRETSAEYVSLGLSFKLDEDGEATWRSVLIGDKLPSGQWVHIALVVDVEAREQFQAFVDGKRSALGGERISHGHGLQFPSKYLQDASSWTRMTVGGELDGAILAQPQAEGNQIQSPNCLQSRPFRKPASKQSQMGFAAVLDDVFVIDSALTEKAITRLQHNGTVLFRLKLQHVVESHCTNVLRLLCRLSEAKESSHHDSSITDGVLSDRWISLLVRMLLDTCRGQELVQVQICTLLQRTLPHLPPPPDLDLKSLGQVLFGPFDGDPTTAVEWQRMEEVFSAFQSSNGAVGNHVDAFAGTGKQNELLYLLMQQHGMLHRTPQRSNNGSDCSHSTREVTVRALPSQEMKLSVRFAAGVHLFQKLYHASAWMGCMNGLVANAAGTFRSAAGLEQMLQSSEATFAGLVAVISTIAGYSEEALNLHCAANQNGAAMWTSANFLEWRVPFASFAPVKDGNIDQANHLQALVTAMLDEDMRRAICLSARKDLLTEHDNNILAVHSVDRKIAMLAHLRARVLRFFMVSLLHEQPTTANKPWHRFLLGNDTVFENLLQVASSNSKDFVTDALGPDAKTAMKLPRLRVFRKECLRGQNDRRVSLTRWTLLDLERLQWRLWEEMGTSQSSSMTSLWWQQRSSINGKVSLEVIGGDAELNELRVKALEHFPTVRLAQAKISANSGLWFYEVLLLTDGLMQIGYVDGDFTADPHQGQGVGDHFNSWAFDGFRCKKWNVDSYDYGEHWRADDVVGVLLDTDRMELSYFLNGKCLGVAFSSLPITASSQMCPANPKMAPPTWMMEQPTSVAEIWSTDSRDLDFLSNGPRDALLKRT